jgi:hypothetical protein
MERPEEVNAYIRGWLTKKFPSSAGTFKRAEGEL